MRVGKGRAMRVPGLRAAACSGEADRGGRGARVVSARGVLREKG
ncbi:hypothetical protein BN2476_760006 [Paraburkholderia piptadeniae]|uniref:Uncharacterized protein n=1 Tax=Paraburkholderia piptadeniae TaxID=1701573 RepID=A0A1N7SSD3_9BURK|nr:hypothetical protein BN2476_760006 [Paraburkholderia piptadeniae]